MCGTCTTKGMNVFRDATIGGARIVVAIIGPNRDMPHKSDVVYTITVPREFAGQTHLWADLCVPTQDTEALTAERAYRDLLGFLSACGEGYEYEMRNGLGSSENADMFPRDVAEWAYVYAEEIAAEAYADDESERDTYDNGR